MDEDLRAGLAAVVSSVQDLTSQVGAMGAALDRNTAASARRVESSDRQNHLLKFALCAAMLFAAGATIFGGIAYHQLEAVRSTQRHLEQLTGPEARASTERTVAEAVAEMDCVLRRALAGLPAPPDGPAGPKCSAITPPHVYPGR